MEAKDTVMSMKKLSEINSAMPSEAKYGEVFEVIAQAQAEISFKAGADALLETLWGDGLEGELIEEFLDGAIQDSTLWIDDIKKVKEYCSKRKGIKGKWAFIPDTQG